KKVYGREADVIYPPVDVERFKLKREKQDFYLTASRLVPYKRIDLIVEAFSKMPEKKLVVIGDGPEMSKIRKIAGANIEI
ncbi:glycosyltransferase, partial [Klebsiella pneumoniae]|nr:glycosyltransferase [Klebsiella pneumoniae]